MRTALFIAPVLYASLTPASAFLFGASCTSSGRSNTRAPKLPTTGQGSGTPCRRERSMIVVTNVLPPKSDKEGYATPEDEINMHPNYWVDPDFEGTAPPGLAGEDSPAIAMMHMDVVHDAHGFIELTYHDPWMPATAFYMDALDAEDGINDGTWSEDEDLDKDMNDERALMALAEAEEMDDGEEEVLVDDTLEDAFDDEEFPVQT